MLNAVNQFGDNCLIVATKHQRAEHVETLCKCFLVNRNSSNYMKNSALHVAVLNDSILIVKTLIKCRVDLLIKNSDDLNCLELAYRMGHTDLYEYLKPIIYAEVNWR